jgi:hypothetical protein
MTIELSGRCFATVDYIASRWTHRHRERQTQLLPRRSHRSPSAAAGRLLGAVCLLLTIPASVLAAPNCSALLKQGCTCAIPLGAEADPIGSLTNIKGDVLVSGAGGFTPITAAVPVKVGDSIIVPTGGHAVFVAGSSCNRDLPSESNLVIRDIGGCACAMKVEANVDVKTTTGQIGTVVGLGALLAGGGTAALFLTHKHEQPVSP